MKLKTKQRIVAFEIWFTIFLVLFIGYKLESHCKYYCVYYAQHMTEKVDMDVVAKVLARNLYYIERVENEKYSYDFDGSKTLYLNDENGDILYYFSADGFGFDYFDNNQKVVWYFDHDMKYYDISSQSDEIEEEEIEVNEQVIKEVKQDIYDLIEPIIEIQPEPPIKLQWIFNHWFYAKQDKRYRD